MFNVRLCALIFAALCFFSVSAEEAESKHVLTLTKDNFDTTINENEFVLVKFYAPWCGHCKALAPEYEKAAETMAESKSKIILAKVDATVDSELAQRFKVQGYPTLKFFKSGTPLEYNGGRTASTIISWLEKKTGPPLVSIDSAEAFDSMKADKKLVVVFFSTASDDSSKEFKAVQEAANKFDDITFAHVKDSALFDKLKGKNNQLVLLRTFDEPEVAFEGNWEEKAISDFVHSHRVPLVTEFSPETAQVVFQSHIKVHVLAFSGKKSNDYDAHMELLKVSAKGLKGKVHVVMVNMDDDESARVGDFFGVTKEDLPTFRVLDMSEDMLKFQPEKKDVFTSAYIEEFTDKVLKGEIKPHLKSADEPSDWNDNPIKVLVATTFQERAVSKDKAVFVKFYAPWCGHCKALVPVWEELAKHYADKPEVMIAKCDSTENELEDIKIASFPTLKFSPKGATNWIEYRGDRTKEALIKFIDSNGELQSAESKEEGHDEL